MFGSSKSNNSKSTESKLNSNGSKKMNTTPSTCVIVSDTIIEGKFNSKSDTRVDGKIKGEILCEARIIMGTQAVIEGNIKTNEATITGSFVGDLVVKDLLKLGSTAKVDGNVSAKQLLVEEGAILNGEIAIGKDNKGGNKSLT